jgi:hypothetical protein
MSDEISKEQLVAEILMGDVKFVSYDGKYPNLCSGTLVIRLGSREWKIRRLSSGGGVWFDKNNDEQVDEGDWSIDNWPEGFPESLKEKVLKVVNECVDHGCCGGCI